MGAYAMALPPADPAIRVGGLPIRLLAEDAIRRARARLAGRPAAAAPPGTPAPVEPARPAEPVAAPAAVPQAAPRVADTAVLDRCLRGFTILDLYVEATRVARAAAADHEDLEGLAAGRTYGDRSISAGFLTPACYRAAAAEAKRRAEMAGATADFLRGMLGHEGTLAGLLTEAGRV